mgnify:CR=1 FL=1
MCPAKCIYVRGADNDPVNPTSPGERFGFVYEINYLRCIHCDMCVEACPTEAITESKLFEFSFTNRADAIYTKAELVVDDFGQPKRLPWEDWRDGESDMTSGWMRATASAGNAEYAGVVQWSGDLGVGVRAAEAFLARLEHEQHTARDVGLARRQQLRSTHQHRGVCVVTAGVHRAIDLRCEIEASVFRHGQGIHVGTQQHGGARAATFQHGRDTAGGLVQGEVERKVVERLAHRLAGGWKMVPQLGPRVQGAAQGHRLAENVLRFFTQSRHVHTGMLGTAR